MNTITFIYNYVKGNHMKLFRFVLSAVLLAAVSLPASAAPTTKNGKYKTGRVIRDPAKLAAMKARSKHLYRHFLTTKVYVKAVPSVFDCRAMGWVPPVRDQGQCGSCWDFSGSGVVTSALIKATIISNGTNQCSEQYTLDCGQNGGCNGDDNVTVLDWAKKTGLPLDSDYGPYTASSGQCKQVPSGKLLKINDWGFVDGSGQGVTDKEKIKAAMVQFGPIGCAVAAGGSDFWNTGQGTDTGTSGSIDHDVILVGFDDGHDNGDGSKGAWVMRNSWGTSWGDKCPNSAYPNPPEGGYAWVKYGADSIGTEAVWAVVTPLPPSVPPVITSSLTVSAQVGGAFSYQITATNSPTSFNATSLPSGLTVNTGNGIIGGTPTTSGTYNMIVSASNQQGVGTATVVLTVSGGPNPPNPPTPTPTTGTITLGQDMSKGTYTLVPQGTIVINGDMTFREVLQAFEKCRVDKTNPDAKKPCCGNEPPPLIAPLEGEVKQLKQDVKELKEGIKSILDLLGPKKKVELNRRPDWMLALRPEPYVTVSKGEKLWP